MVWDILLSPHWSARTPLALLVAAIAGVAAVCVYGAAVAWAARLLGDDYPVRQGRGALNPREQYDPIGSTAVVLFGWGWAKPVAVHRGYLRSPRRDAILTALAGPAACILAGCALCLGVRFAAPASAGAGSVLAMLAFVPMMLGFFSLLPFPPLAGKTVVSELLPQDAANAYDRFMDRWGFLILLGIIFLFRAVMMALVVQPVYALASAVSGMSPIEFDNLLRMLG